MNTLYKYFVFFILVLANCFASEKQLLQDELGEFKKIPKEIVFKISFYLYGEDFQNFLLTSKSLKTLLIEEETLFLPSNDESLVKYACDSDFQDFCLLVTRHPKRILENRVKNILATLPIDQGMYGEMNFNKLTLNWIAYNKLYKAFKLWGCNNFDEMYEGAKFEIGDSFEQTSYYYTSDTTVKELMIFRWEQLAYVNEERRQELIDAYEKGSGNLISPNPSKVSYWKVNFPKMFKEVKL